MREDIFEVTLKTADRKEIIVVSGYADDTARFFVIAVTVLSFSKFLGVRVSSGSCYQQGLVNYRRVRA